MVKSVKRTTEVWRSSTSAVRFTDLPPTVINPSNELLGYFHGVRYVDALG
jgi:hypothetical protein